MFNGGDAKRPATYHFAGQVQCTAVPPPLQK